jgi:hypothetical protein
MVAKALTIRGQEFLFGVSLYFASSIGKINISMTVGCFDSAFRQFGYGISLNENGSIQEGGDTFDTSYRSRVSDISPHFEFSFFIRDQSTLSQFTSCLGEFRLSRKQEGEFPRVTLKP